MNDQNVVQYRGESRTTRRRAAGRDGRTDRGRLGGHVGRPEPAAGDDCQAGESRRVGGQTAHHGPPATPTANSATQFRALEGAWKVVRVDASDAAARLRGAYRLDFQPRMAVLTFSKRSDHDTFYSYSVDPTTAPRTIDLFSGAEQKNLAWLGIYQLDGNRLTICLNGNIPALKSQQRPSQFDRNSGDAVLLLERDQPSDDERALQGQRTLISQIEDGTTIPERKIRGRMLNFIWGNVFSAMLVINDERYQISSGTYVLEPAKEPKTITLFARLSPMRSGDRVEEAELIGIYKLEGDRLTIAFRKNGPRPEKFESPPGSGVTLLVLERNQPNAAVRPKPGETNTERAGTPTTFRTVAVTRGDIVATISATGTVEPEEVVDIGTQVAGQIVKFRSRSPRQDRPELQKQVDRLQLAG